jgi:hypothetical protein
MGQYAVSKYGKALYGTSYPGHPYAFVSGKVMWVVQVDWDRNGSFASGLVEPQAISAMRIRRGRTGASSRRLRADGMGQIFGDESFEIEIVDSTGRYDPTKVTGVLYKALGAPGTLLRVMIISTTTKAQAQPVFVGTLESVDYDSSLSKATLRGHGLAKWLQIGAAMALYCECQSSNLSGYDRYFNAGSSPFPINYWKGRPAGLKLSACVDIVLEKSKWGLGVYYGSAVFGTDEPTFFYLDGETAWEVLKDLADGFAARLIFLRDGRLYVMDRKDIMGLASVPPAAPAAAQQSTGLVRSGPFETLRNKAEVMVRYLSVYKFTIPYPNAAYVGAWTNAGPIAVEPGATEYISIRFMNTTEKPLQGSWGRVNSDAVTEPWPMAVWSSPDKTGTNMGGSTGTGEGEFTLMQESTGVQVGNNQRYCQVRLKNWSTTLTAYFFNLQVQMIGFIESGDPGSVMVSDAESVALNGERSMKINNRWIQDSTMAANIGEAYLEGVSKRERASVASLAYKWSGDDLYGGLMTYDLGTYVSFGTRYSTGSKGNYGLVGRWLITGQELEWESADGQAAEVRLYYEKVADVAAGNSSSGAGNGVAIFSWMHTVGPGANKLLVVGVSRRAYSANTTVSYMGYALTRLAWAQQGYWDYPRVELWYLVNPMVGTGVISVNCGVIDYAEGGAVDFGNVNQASPFGATGTGSGAGGPASVTIAADYGDLVIDVVGYAGGAAGTAGSGQTEKWNLTSDTNWRGGGSVKEGAGAVGMNWTVPSGGWAQVAAQVKKA